MIPLEISMRMVSEIVDCGTSTLATGMPSVSTPWNRNAPMITWLMRARYARAADQDRRGRDKAHLPRRGVKLHKAVALAVDDDAHRAQHRGNRGAFDGDLPAQPPRAPHGVISLEGGEALAGKLETLEALDAAARLRMIGLTWNDENEIGYPAVGGDRRGLKPFGREVLSRMDDLRILADVSHLNEAGFWDVIERSQLPPVASHSNCRWLCEVARNLTKEQARAIIQRGGFIGVNFFSAFLRRDGQAAIEDVVRHIDALMELGADKCVGLGSDFDGIDAWPQGLASPADVPRLLEALVRRGYSQGLVEDIAGNNLYRALRLTNRAQA